MPAYALLLRPATNRLYSKGAAALNTSELSVVNETSLGGSLRNIEPTTLGGVGYVRFETGPPLTQRDIVHLSNLSSAFALFRLFDDQRMLPITVAPVAYLDDDLLTIQRYKGKTNEQFTKLLLNLTLAASAVGAEWPGRRLRILDPVCGRGTSLNQGLVYGFDVDGIEVDRAAYDAYKLFLATWLKDKRYKHQVQTMPVRRDAKVVGRRFEIVFARDKDEYKADDVRRVRFVNDDTTHAGDYYRKPVFDAVIADLPYGVQHASRARPGAVARRPDNLVAGALRGWVGAMKPGAAIGLSWNTKTLSRGTLVDLLAGYGLAEHETDAVFEHRVDHAITRDLVVAVKKA